MSPARLLLRKLKGEGRQYFAGFGHSCDEWRRSCFIRATASRTVPRTAGARLIVPEAPVSVVIRFRRGACRDSRSRSLRLRSVRLGANTRGKVRCSRETRYDSVDTRSIGDRQANQLGRGDSFKESQAGRLRRDRRLRRCLRQRPLSVLRSLIIARRPVRKKRFLQRTSTDFTAKDQRRPDYDGQEG